MAPSPAPFGRRGAIASPPLHQSFTAFQPTRRQARATLASMQPVERRTVGNRPFSRLVLLLLALAVLALGAAGCGRGDDEGDAGSDTNTSASEDTTTAEELSGDVIADGSSTVGPLTRRPPRPSAKSSPASTSRSASPAPAAGSSGSARARPTSPTPRARSRTTRKRRSARTQASTYVDYTVAIDALTVIVNTENDWVTCLTVEQLMKMWEPGAEGKIDNWNQIDPSFPDEPLTLSGPGTDSGTFDYFTARDQRRGGREPRRLQRQRGRQRHRAGGRRREGRARLPRLHVLRGEQDTLKAVEVDGGDGCVAPSAETAQDGTYTPLSRPLFIYVKDESIAERPEVKALRRLLPRTTS